MKHCKANYGNKRRRRRKTHVKRKASNGGHKQTQQRQTKRRKKQFNIVNACKETRKNAEKKEISKVK